VERIDNQYIKDTTRRWEDINFMFEWQERFFKDFRPPFQRFPKSLQSLSKGHKNVVEHFPKISKDYRRLPKTFEEDPKMFGSYSNEFKYNQTWYQWNHRYLHQWGYGKYTTRVYQWCIFQYNTRVYIINMVYDKLGETRQCHYQPLYVNDKAVKLKTT